MSEYVHRFNADDDEQVINLVPNAAALDWMEANVPLFDCPDKTIEEIYYYRWWTFRKHLKSTPAGTIVTEFITDVRHAGSHNSISCATGHHLAEARWLRDQRPIDEYALFWFRSNDGKPEPKFHNYSSWIAWALLERAKVTGDFAFVTCLLDELIADYAQWESEKQLPDGLFWQFDVRDGMEESITGSRKHKNARPTISSYMYGNALAITRIAEMAKRPEVVETFRAKAAKLKQLVQSKLWDDEAQFFKAQFEEGSLSDAREEIGFVPWVFRLPDSDKSIAWKQLTDEEGFQAPCGITTAERRHPKFRSHGVGRCEWDGAVWPFATSQTLEGLANVLRYDNQSFVSRSDYLAAMQTYARAHHKNGKPYIGEYHCEITGEWLKGDNPRSSYYNHSTYCDLVINGLIGVLARDDDRLELSPLLPEGAWDYFRLDRVPYHGRLLTITWDRDGSRYRHNSGLTIEVDGRQAHRSDLFDPVIVELP